ncbi:wsv155 [White spot syndrome virus]|uniref:Wsv155 n=4 Tax=White spot syndrome virus TaxID=342409 RepID=Q8VB42_WSSVS|nr:wsv155 [Shrimp white spot syndrome virus]AFX59533.1 wsv155 [White spot syndrome virus]AAL33159.1 wsv155 [Shrimp white spot syndrome virus]AAL89079.1 WSSV211 [Shrimp white spot syndrome virus]AWQ60337.1 wsv155 [Shrimp white spot syndrome virus]AWQ60750.1 wsv155 [Shrimp white spot syndrome virus]
MLVLPPSRRKKMEKIHRHRLPLQQFLLLHHTKVTQLWRGRKKRKKLMKTKVASMKVQKMLLL